jgi:hypothetical protein
MTPLVNAAEQKPLLLQSPPRDPASTRLWLAEGSQARPQDSPISLLPVAGCDLLGCKRFAPEALVQKPQRPGEVAQGVQQLAGAS